jgi:addiction module RelE/StbE family toxin
MWTVRIASAAEKALRSAPVQVQARYDAWLAVAQQSGPTGLRAVGGFRDEALAGKWAGHRSSRLNLQWRIIYQVKRDTLEIQIVRATPHDYRR